MPDVFAGPYVDLQPELAFVVESGGPESSGRVVGYVIAAADTRAFVDRVRSDWVSEFEAKYCPPTLADAPIVAMGTDPERMLIPEVDEFPAHLHINLLPEVQGRGLGRVLIDRLRAELAARGIRGLHLTMDPDNLPARSFYDRLGFVELPSGALGINTLAE